MSASHTQNTHQQFLSQSPQSPPNTMSREGNPFTAYDDAYGMSFLLQTHRAVGRKKSRAYSDAAKVTSSKIAGKPRHANRSGFDFPSPPARPGWHLLIAVWRLLFLLSVFYVLAYRSV